MLLLFLQAILLYVISLACWYFLRQFMVKSTLENIPGPPSQSMLTGNLGQMFSLHGWSFHKRIEETYGSVMKINGLLGDKQLYVFDPKAMHHVLVKDQDVYEETSFYVEVNRLMFGNGLLATLGDRHRKQRKMLNPIFSTSHMRGMVPIFHRITYKLRNALVLKVTNDTQEVDMLQWMTRTALELIGQTGLGYSFDPLTNEAANHPYSKAMKELLPTIYSMAIARHFLPQLVKIGSSGFRRYVVNLVPWNKLRRVRDMVEIMEKTSVEVLESKKRALEEGEDAVLRQVGEGKDIITNLLRANMEASDEDRLPESEILGQMSSLIFAAMDTTSGSLARILHLLACNPDVQDNLRKEITAARMDQEDLSYDELVSLPFLDAVCRETLRLYPPVSFVSRTSRKDMVLPLSTPITGVDGNQIREVLVPSNTDVLVGLLASNRNPSIWGQDAAEWKPERWLKPLPESIGDAHLPGVFSNLMTFLGGGRACIGFQFAQLEMKVVLTVLLERFRFSLSEKEIEWNMSALAIPTVKGGDGRPQMPLRLTLVNPVL